MIIYPNELNIIFEKLDKNNIKPMIIGGYIRDYLLNISSKDIDIELYGVSSLKKIEKILQEFGNINSVGKSFGVCKLSYENLDLDFSLPRMDSKISSGHSGFNIKIDKNLSFKTASSRRDFTMNAIGYDILNKKLLDPFSGQNDIKNKIIRAVDIEKISEDPLRVLRAVQFSSRFNFLLDNKLFDKCRLMIENRVLDELPKERIFDEIKKLLLKSIKPSIGFSLLKKLNGFLYFKELATLKNEEFEHILLSLDMLSSYEIKSEKIKLTLMLASLCYYFDTKKIEIFLRRFTNEKELIKNIVTIIENKDTLDLSNIKDFDIYFLATKLNIEQFCIFLRGINLGKIDDKINALIKKAKKLGILNKKADAILKGQDIINLGIKPSKRISDILNKAYIAQISDRFNNHKNAIKWLKKELFG